MRKKIFILAHSYGMQFLESCNQYTQLFDKNLYEVCVGFLLGADSPAVRKKIEAERVVFFQMPSMALQGLKLKAIWTILKFCRQEHFEIVVCHRYKPSYIMLIVAQFCQINAFLFVMHAFGTMSSIPRRMLMGLLAKKNMVFAAVSSAARDDMRKDMLLIDKERIITLYNIIDHPLFEKNIFSREEARARLNLPPETFIFGHIGRLVKEKDQANLIKAFHLIKSQCGTAKLVIIGDGKIEQELRQLAHELQLGPDIIFTGFIDDGFRFMKAFDTFVLTSTEEAFGRVSLEAMVAKIPLIATNISGIPEVVGDSGFLVEPGNAQKLAQEMLKVYELTSEERRRWGEKGYQHMLKNFSIQPFRDFFWSIPLFRKLKTGPL